MGPRISFFPVTTVPPNYAAEKGYGLQVKFRGPGTVLMWRPKSKARQEDERELSHRPWRNSRGGGRAVPPSSPKLRCRLPPAGGSIQASKQRAGTCRDLRQSSSPMGRSPNPGPSAPPSRSRERPGVAERPAPHGPNVHRANLYLHSHPCCDRLVHPGDSDFRLSAEAEISYLPRLLVLPRLGLPSEEAQPPPASSLCARVLPFRAQRRERIVPARGPDHTW